MTSYDPDPICNSRDSDPICDPTRDYETGMRLEATYLETMRNLQLQAMQNSVHPPRYYVSADTLQVPPPPTDKTSEELWRRIGEENGYLYNYKKEILKSLEIKKPLISDDKVYLPSELEDKVQIKLHEPIIIK